MKKIIVVILTFLLLIIPTNIKAQEYGSATCSYGDGEVIITLTSDGSNVTMDVNMPDRHMNTLTYYQFYNTEKDVFQCHDNLYKSLVMWAFVHDYEYHLDSSKYKNDQERSLMLKLDANSSTNNLEVFAGDSLTCFYEEAIVSVSKSDGELDLKFEVTEDYRLRTLITDNVVNSDFISGDNLKCGSYEVVCPNAQGNKFCHFQKLDNDVAGNQSAEDIEDELGIYNGDQFEKELGRLKYVLDNYTGFSFSDMIGSKNYNAYAVYDYSDPDSNELCSNNPNSNTYCNKDDNPNYYITKGVKDVVTYCNEQVYGNTSSASNTQNDRLEECKDFTVLLYPALIEQGIINDLGSDCGFMSQDLLEFIQYFLNLLAIIAPILAIGLGILDFIKVIANGDADKEMKNAGKNFLIRVGVAMLLLIVPLIIAFILNTFGDVITGYNSDDPFCGLEVGLE